MFQIEIESVIWEWQSMTENLGCKPKWMMGFVFKTGA
jgi:hypothetical protein